MNHTPWVAVADLHGHLHHLDALLDHLDAHLGRYRLALLGDYVDKGPDTPALLDRLIELERARGDDFVAVLGNHDLACLRALGLGGGPDPRWFAQWSERYWSTPAGDTVAAYGADSHAEFVEAFPAAHADFLRRRPWVHDTGDYLFVHAGLARGPLLPQLEPLRTRRLPLAHLHLPLPLREKSLAAVHDPDWERVVVSGHTKHPARRWSDDHPHAPNLLLERRIVLSGEVDATARLYAIVLPERRVLLVDEDLRVADYAPCDSSSGALPSPTPSST